MEDEKQNPFAIISLIIMFVLAIGVFAGVAFGCKRLLADIIQNEDLRTVVSFIIAAAATLASLQGLKFLNHSLMKNK